MRTKFNETLIALKECLKLNEASLYTSPSWRRRFIEKDIIKAIDAANKKCVKKFGKTKGRSADFELAVAIDPTIATIQLKIVGLEAELKLNIVHSDKETVKCTMAEFEKILKTLKDIDDVKIVEFEEATSEHTGKAIVHLSLKDQ